ncbi:hypothetical protein BU16DRAFT_525153 [Lophium mytilinum]|uniref:Uncharacterized protein n=1 Tax=Lophium mytilinum TaxID=390894 RepID=A0A6A6QYZ6_9PEZI|nr:hypothetical protein BU16DRAFT_525153 [Lophium mytilinum]
MASFFLSSLSIHLCIYHVKLCRPESLPYTAHHVPPDRLANTPRHAPTASFHASPHPPLILITPPSTSSSIPLLPTPFTSQLFKMHFNPLFTLIALLASTSASASPFPAAADGPAPTPTSGTEYWCWVSPACVSAYKSIQACYNTLGGISDPNDSSQSKAGQFCICDPKTKGRLAHQADFDACSVCFRGTNPRTDEASLEEWQNDGSLFCGTNGTERLLLRMISPSFPLPVSTTLLTQRSRPVRLPLPRADAEVHGGRAHADAVHAGAVGPDHGGDDAIGSLHAAQWVERVSGFVGGVDDCGPGEREFGCCDCACAAAAAVFGRAGADAWLYSNSHSLADGHVDANACGYGDCDAESHGG